VELEELIQTWGIQHLAHECEKNIERCLLRKTFPPKNTDIFQLNQKHPKKFPKNRFKLITSFKTIKNIDLSFYKDLQFLTNFQNCFLFYSILVLFRIPQIL
jgi:hypothetical protein